MRRRSRYGRREEVDQGSDSEGREGDEQCREEGGNKKAGKDDGEGEGDRRKLRMGHKILTGKRKERIRETERDQIERQRHTGRDIEKQTREDQERVREPDQERDKESERHKQREREHKDRTGKPSPQTSTPTPRNSQR